MRQKLVTLPSTTLLSFASNASAYTVYMPLQSFQCKYM